MSTTYNDEDLKLLDDADLAAFAARRKWLISARHRTNDGVLLPDESQGKQIPPMDDNDWSILVFRAGRGLAKPFR
jgi:hypothetical protein